MVLEHLKTMAKQVEEAWTRERLNRFAEAMVHMGLLYDRSNGIYQGNMAGKLRPITNWG